MVEESTSCFQSLRSFGSSRLQSSARIRGVLIIEYSAIDDCTLGGDGIVKAVEEEEEIDNRD